MAEAHQPRKPDAIRCPRDFPYARNDPRRDVVRNQIFGPILGVDRVNNVELIDRGGESLVRKSPHDTLLYPTGHPKHPQPRYAWFIGIFKKESKGWSYTVGPVETGDPAESGRIKLGFLLPDEFADDPEVEQAIQQSYDDRLAEAMNTPEHLAQMRALGIAPPEADAPLPVLPDPVAPNLAPSPDVEPKTEA